MINRFFLILATLGLMASVTSNATAQTADLSAQTPSSTLNVVTTVRPLYALVLAVSDGVFEPQQLIPSGSSAHEFQFKASDARKLEQADLVFWVGPQLETALESSIVNLATNARVVSAMNNPQLDLIALTRPGMFDPHIWLSTDNARAMIKQIAAVLIDVDPDNRDTYLKNAKVANNRIKNLKRQMLKYITPALDAAFLVQHDGLGYLVREFGLNQQGFIAETSGREAGARHIEELKTLIDTGNIKCIFTEPQIASKMAEQLGTESGVRLGELDVIGIDLESSPTLYARIMQKNVRALVNCLSPTKMDP